MAPDGKDFFNRAIKYIGVRETLSHIYGVANDRKSIASIRLKTASHKTISNTGSAPSRTTFRQTIVKERPKEKSKSKKGTRPYWCQKDR